MAETATETPTIMQPSCALMVSQIDLAASMQAAVQRGSKIRAINGMAYAGGECLGVDLSAGSAPRIYDLAEAKLQRLPCPILAGHEPSQVIGALVFLRVHDGKVFFVGRC